MSDADLTAQLRTAAGKVLSDHALDSFVEFTAAEAFIDADGAIDEERVIGHLTSLYAARTAQQPHQPRQWGQSTGHPAGQRAGDTGRAALEKRHGVKNDPNTPTPGSQAVGRGSAAEAELARRYPKGARK